VHDVRRQQWFLLDVHIAQTFAQYAKNPSWFRVEAGARGRAAHLTFWALLFIAFPLAVTPKTWVDSVPADLVTLPQNGFAEVLIPKLLIFGAVWGLGVRLCLVYFRRQLPLGATPSPLYAPFCWLALFLAASLAVGLSNPSSLGLSLPGFASRYESVAFALLEAAWYALTMITAGLMASRVLREGVPLHLMALGACGVGFWTLLQAYGVDPLNLPAPGIGVGANVRASLGHQAYVAAFLAVVLVFWTNWRLLLDRVRALDMMIVALLTASLVASGGRAGLIAALVVLSGLAVTQLRRSPRQLLLLGGVIMVASVLTLSTSPHAQGRLQRLSSAVQGDDPATNSRVVFWQLGLRAIAERPLMGYGVDTFGDVAWWFATPKQADALVKELLPREDAGGVLRIGKLALFRKDGKLELGTLEPYRIHNYLLDLAFASGVPVTLLFLGFVLSSLHILFRTGTALSWATALALLTYLLYGAVWFATPNVDPLVWGLVGLGLGCSDRTAQPASRVPTGRGGERAGLEVSSVNRCT
jgi:O-antigen ligase